jgi:allantoicase
MTTSDNVALKSIDELFSSDTEEPMIESTSTVSHLTRNPISATSVVDFDLEKEQKQILEPEPCKNVAPISPFADCYTNMANAMSGAKIIFATDDWFATAESLLQDGPPIFDPDAFCEQGKVLDGWETRRRRQAGHDWCLVQLSKRAEIHAIELDTAHFTGNNVPNISIDICDVSATDLSKMVAKIPGAYERLLHGGVQGKGYLQEEVADASEAVGTAEWKELLPITSLSPGFETTRMHRFHLGSTTPIIGNLVRINYFPDGGVARFRCWGNSLSDVKPATTPLYMPIKTCKECTVVAHSSVHDESELPSRRLSFHDDDDDDELYSELSSLDQGGIGGTCSNKHYGEPWRLIQTTLGKDMGDGWETARHPNRPGILMMSSKECGSASGLLDTRLSDWAVLRLGKATPGGVARIILDTKHFRGNFPESVSVEGCYDPTEYHDEHEQQQGEGGEQQWFSLIPRSKMSPDAEHVFERSKGQVENADKIVTHVRVSIFPDGGISRVRIYG